MSASGAHQPQRTRTDAGRRTLAVVAEAHLCLTETDGIFALTDAIKLLKLGLVDTLLRGISMVT